MIAFLKKIYYLYLDLSNKKRWSKEISRKLLNNNLNIQLTSLQKDEIIKFWKKYYSNKNIDTIYHQLYFNLNNKFYPNYIPLDFHVTKLKSFFNRMELADAYDDKNLYSFLFPNTKQPNVVLKNMNGLFFVNGYECSFDEVVKICSNLNDVIIKPTINTGKGKNVLKFSSNDGFVISSKQRIEDLLYEYGKDYIIQECIIQHPLLSEFNQSSLNTIRCMSLRFNQEILILGSTLRVGSPGSFVDNANNGGMFCGINKDGVLQTTGYSLNPIKIYNDSYNGINLKNKFIPFYESIESIAIDLHKNLPYFDLIAWDFAIDNNNDIVLIEFNIKDPGIHVIQIPHGPLFGNKTVEILNKLKNS